MTYYEVQHTRIGVKTLCNEAIGLQKNINYDNSSCIRLDYKERAVQQQERIPQSSVVSIRSVSECAALAVALALALLSFLNAWILAFSSVSMSGKEKLV